MNNFLFPTDFSKTSAQLLQFAVDFANAANAKLTLFNAYQGTDSPRRPIIGENSAKERALEKLRNFAKLHTDGDAWRKIDFMVKKGYSIRNLIKMSKSNEFDLIIMGKGSGYDWLTKIIGSKTSFVSKMAYCPVLVVPPHQTFEDTKKILLTGIIPPSSDKKLQNYLDAINFKNICTDAPIIRLEKTSFLKKGFSFRGWPHLILSLEIPALVINHRFWQSRKVSKKSRKIGMEHLINSSKFGTNLN